MEKDAVRMKVNCLFDRDKVDIEDIERNEECESKWVGLFVEI